MPLAEFDGDPLWPVDEDELPRVKVHDRVASFETTRFQLCDLLLDVIDREADVVHANLVQIADARVRGDTDADTSGVGSLCAAIHSQGRV